MVYLRFISGTPTTNGTYTSTITATNGNGRVNSTLTISVGQTYAQWAAQNGLTGNNGSAPAAR